MSGTLWRLPDPPLPDKPKLFAGVDVGLQGAVGIVDEGGAFVAVVDLPIVIAPWNRRMICGRQLADLAAEYDPCFSIIERVSSRPGEGVVSAFSFGYSAGIIAGVWCTHLLPYQLLLPQTWRKRMGLSAGMPKSASIDLTLTLFPDAAPHITLKCHDGRAEALLLAELARRTKVAGAFDPA